MSDTFMSGQAPQTSGATGPAGGDLSGTYPNPSISTGKMQRGQLALTSIASPNFASGTITFPAAFAAAPSVIMLTVQFSVVPGTGTAGAVTANVAGTPTAASFIYFVQNLSGASVTATLYWLAIE